MILLPMHVLQVLRREMSDLSIKLEKMIQHQPGIKARKLAKDLGLKTCDINKVLYGELSQKLVQDETYQWYPVGYDKNKDITFKPKKVVNKVASIRGSSPFTLNKSNESIELIYNKSHPFFHDIYQLQDAAGRKALDMVFSSFSMVMDDFYDQSELFEDVVDAWGAALSRKIALCEL